jgi:VIT1/CCC1 family predicted Fe2+/Mn2+ transporter
LLQTLQTAVIVATDIDSRVQEAARASAAGKDGMTRALGGLPAILPTLTEPTAAVPWYAVLTTAAVAGAAVAVLGARRSR